MIRCALCGIAIAGEPYWRDGEEIPLDARIMAMADALDAMTTDRPYRPARFLAAREEIVRPCVGA